jgi:hypothetical protein
MVLGILYLFHVIENIITLSNALNEYVFFFLLCYKL